MSLFPFLSLRRINFKGPEEPLSIVNLMRAHRYCGAPRKGAPLYRLPPLPHVYGVVKLKKDFCTIGTRCSQRILLPCWMK
jgi:hypothetical protein